MRSFFSWKPRSANVSLSNEEVLALVNQYFSLLDGIYRSGSSIRDIDSLMEIMHQKVLYKHERFGARFSKSRWYKAFCGNLKRGVYCFGPEKQTRVLSQQFGNQYIAVEYSIGEMGNDGLWTAAESRLVLFGFKDGLISRVEELW